MDIEYLKSSKSGNFFLLAGPCVIEGEKMALDIAEHIKRIAERLDIPYVFKGSYRKANRSRIDSFTGIGDEKALKILAKVRDTLGIPVVSDVHSVSDVEMAADYLDLRSSAARPNCSWRPPKPAKSSISKKDNSSRPGQ